MNTFPKNKWLILGLVRRWQSETCNILYCTNKYWSLFIKLIVLLFLDTKLRIFEDKKQHKISALFVERFRNHSLRQMSVVSCGADTGLGTHDTNAQRMDATWNWWGNQDLLLPPQSKLFWNSNWNIMVFLDVFDKLAFSLPVVTAVL